MENIISFIINNLVHTGPILIAAGLGIVIMFERFMALTFSYPMRDLNGFIEKVKDLFYANRIGEAIKLCEAQKKKPVTLVIQEALLRAHQPEDLIQESLEIVVSEATARIQIRTAYLGTIANVSTLLGLFGTIAGLIHSFEALGSANAQQRSTLLANGISTAMNATMMGLFVAIPCMIAYSYLMNRTGRLVGEVERTAARMMTMIKQRYYEVDSPSKSAGNVRSAA